MSKTRAFVLGGKTFDLPEFPILLSQDVYPECRDLTNGGLAQRIFEAGGSLDCTKDEFKRLIELAFVAASFADPELTRDLFDKIPITPPELTNAFYVIRVQTGGWVAPENVPEGDDVVGEAQGAETPQP